jgi:hypothetical protein
MALASSGDLAGARAVLERAVELGKANLSEDDPDVLLTAYQLGTVLQQADDPSGARRVLEEAYAAGLWRLGDSDALMLKISHGIGVVAEELGNRHEARKAFGRVAEHGPAVLGGEHWAVVRAQGYLGADSVRSEGAPALAEPTTELGVVSPGEHAVPERPSVQPPSPVNQQVWTRQASTDRAAGADGQRQRGGNGMPDGDRYGAIEEPTIAQPIIAPRSGPGVAQRPPQGQPGDPGPRELGGPLGDPRQRPEQAEPAFDHGYPPAPDASTDSVGGYGYPARPGAGDYGNPPPPAHTQAGRPPTHAPMEGTGYPYTPADRVGDYGHPPAAVAESRGDHGYPPAEFGATPPGHGGGYRSGPEYAHSGASSAEDGRGSASYRKGLGLFAAIAAVLASIIAVAALVFVRANRSGDSGSDSDVPTLAGPPPSDVRLRDSGAAVRITWQDPSDGTVSFMVTMGRRGESLRPMTTLGPGQTSYELGGLNVSLNYCFTVIAVYRSDQFATSPQACTNRASATPR